MTEPAYLIVQPYVDGARRFWDATIVSEHATLDDAYGELLRIGTELQSHGLPGDVLELYIVDRERRMVRVESYRVLVSRVASLTGSRRGGACPTLIAGVLTTVFGKFSLRL